MKDYTVENIRNIALVGHGASGKTSLGEAMLFTAHATRRLGKTDDGSSCLDHDPDEVKRKISLNLSAAFLDWKDHKINLLDTPGYADFVGEVASALRVADAALLLLKAEEGVEVGIVGAGLIDLIGGSRGSLGRGRSDQVAASCTTGSRIPGRSP